MASNIDIQKKCEWCGVIFTAHKTSTAYCSHRCANLAYKERVRKKRVQEFQLKFDEEAKPQSEKEFLTPTEVSAFLGVERTSIYRYIRYGKIKAVIFDGKTLIRRSDIDKMFDYITVSEKKKSPSPTSTPLPRLKRNLALRSRGFMRLRRSIISLAHSIVAGHIGARNILTPTLPRKLLMQVLPSGTALLSCKRSSV